MQPVINAPEIATAREQQLFNGKNFHVFIYNKTESISGLHQHGNDSNLLIVFYV
ncbi:chb operon repressor [Escherichia coli]|nr:chb operon repressor [Escherichia coli]